MRALSKETLAVKKGVLHYNPADCGADYFRKRYGAYGVLWLRVYIRAVFDYVQYRNAKSIRKAREYQSAKRWLFTTNGGLDVICEAFNFPLYALRVRACTMTILDVKKLEHLERNGLVGLILGGVDSGNSQ